MCPTVGGQTDRKPQNEPKNISWNIHSYVWEPVEMIFLVIKP